MFEFYREEEDFKLTINIFEKIINKLKEVDAISIKNIDSLETPNTKEGIMAILENVVKEKSLVQEVVSNILSLPSFSSLDLDFDYHDLIIGKDYVIYKSILYLTNPFCHYEKIIKENIKEFNSNDISFSDIGVISSDKIEILKTTKDEIMKKNRHLSFLDIEKKIQDIVLRSHKDKPEEIHIYKKDSDIIINFKKNGFIVETDLNLELISDMNTFFSCLKQKFNKNSFIYELNSKDKYKFVLSEDNDDLLVIKCFNMKKEIYKLESINLKNSDLEILKKNLESSSGIVFVSSSENQDKSELIYSILNYIKKHRSNKNILSIENTIKKEIDLVYQLEKNGLDLISFKNKCESSDIICVSDISTVEDMDFVVSQSLSGKLVIVGITAANSISALAKILSLVNDRIIISDNLISIVHNALVPAICQRCCVEYTFIKDKFYQNLYSLDNAPKSTDTIAHENIDGCFDCNNGRKDYIQLNEILVNDKVLVSFIKNGLDINKLRIEKRSSSWRNIYVSSLDFLKSKQVSSKDIINNIGFYKIH